MRKKKSWPFFVVVILILVAAYFTFFGFRLRSEERRVGKEC